MRIKVMNATINQEDSLDFSIQLTTTEAEKKAFESVPIPEEVKKAMESKRVIIGFDVNDFISYIEKYQDSRQVIT